MAANAINKTLPSRKQQHHKKWQKQQGSKNILDMSS